MTEEWSDTSYLFRAVGQGGMGVTRRRFKVSGYLNDSGGLPNAEYQPLLERTR